MNRLFEKKSKNRTQPKEPMKRSILLTLALAVGALSAAGQAKNKDAKLEALLDRAFDKEQGRDKNRDGKMTLTDFRVLHEPPNDSL